MKKSELKAVLKPLVKECIEECINEVLFESGVISGVVSEVLKGIDVPSLVEALAPRGRILNSAPAPVSLPNNNMGAVVQNTSPRQIAEQMKLEGNSAARSRQIALEEQMSKAYGMNILENVEPVLAERQGSSQADPMAGIAPQDPGIDISKIPGLTTLNFKRHIGKE